jgi:hypothetical protein
MEDGNEGKGAEVAMANIKTTFGLLAAVAAVVGVVAFGAAKASASGAPIVIPYEKTCDAAGHCLGTAGDGDTFEMQVTSFLPMGKAAQLTVTESIKVGGEIWLKAELSGHASPAGFIVLNGTVTEGPFAGAQVHQRSNFDGLVGDPPQTKWVGELRIMPASG